MTQKNDVAASTGASDEPPLQLTVLEHEHAAGTYYVAVSCRANTPTGQVMDWVLLAMITLARAAEEWREKWTWTEVEPIPEAPAGDHAQ